MPAHAAMQMSAEASNTMVDGSDAMESCLFPPVLCGSVLAIVDQSNDGLQSVESQVAKNTHLVIEMLDPDQGQQNLSQQYSLNDLNANQSSAPRPYLSKPFF